MKKIMLVLLAVATAIPASAAEIQLPHVTVYGTATAEVTPDKLVWSVKVQNKGPALDIVAGEHNKMVQATMQLIKDAGVDEKSLQTSSMEFGQNWEFKGNSRVQEGYFA